MVTLSAAIELLVLVTINCCDPFVPRVVVVGLTVSVGAAPVVMATVGAGAAVFVPCTVAVPDCAFGDAIAVIVMVQEPSGAIELQPL
jgi:hypothetical protein